MNTDALVQEFRQELPWQGNSDKTARMSAYHVRLYFDVHETPETPGLKCLTRQNVVRWLDMLANSPPYRSRKSKREASTVNNYLKSLKRFANWAVSRGYLSENPFSHLRGLTERDRVILAPRPDIVRKIVDVAAEFGANDEMKARNYAIICMLVDTGVRAGEMAAMTLADLTPTSAQVTALDRESVLRDEVEAHIIVHGKNGKDRILALNTPVILALMDYLPLRRAHEGVDALWASDDGEPMTYEAFRGVVQRICKKAGVKVALHDLRRYTHTRMWLKGTDLITAMYLAGHSTTKSFIRYIRSGIGEQALPIHRQMSPMREVEELAAVR